MKHLLLILFSFGTSIGTHGQGQFVFNNRIGSEVNARFINPLVDPSDGSSSSVGSPEWKVILYGGPMGTPVDQFGPLEPFETTFRGSPGSPSAGYIEAIVPIVPWVPIGASASVLVILLGPNGLTDAFGPYTVNGLGGGTTLPPNLQLGTSPIMCCIPEPSAVTLGVLGVIGGLINVLRRKAEPQDN